jgi:hypothetical protein
MNLPLKDEVSAVADGAKMNFYRLSYGLLCGAMFMSLGAGCNQQHQDDSKANPQAAGKRDGERSSNKPAPAVDNPAAESSLDTPPHPAVSAQAGDESSQEKPTGNDAAPADVAEAPAADSAANTTPATDDGERVATPIPPPGALPTIAFTAAHRATCKLFVGDTLPSLDGTTDITGTLPLPIPKNTRYSVYAFVQPGDAETLELMSDLGPLLTQKYGSRGVNAVVVFVGEPDEAAKSFAQEHKNDFATIVSSDGAELSKITDNPQGLMPRIFLIDSEWRILWFDIEYSRTTRRDLDAALRYLTRK